MPSDPAKASTPTPAEVLSPSESTMASYAAQLAGLSVADLRAELTRALRATADELLRLAAVVSELERRGEDLGDLRIGMIGHLRRIASGQVLAELVVRYQGRANVLNRVSLLPIADQRRLLTDEPLEVAVRAADGSIDRRMVNPLWLEQHQLNLLLGTDGIRPIGEQVAILESVRRRTRPSEQPATVKVGAVTADRKRGGLVIGRTFVPKAAVVEALAALAGEVGNDETDESPSKTVSTVVTEAQYKAIRTAAHEGQTKIATLLRRAAIAYGLLTPHQD